MVALVRHLAATAIVGVLILVPRSAPAQAREVPPELSPVHVVVLADESGSLNDADVLHQQEAARTIAFSLLAPGSKMSVVGFGSSDGAGQSAVDIVCPPTVPDTAANREKLTACIGGLRRRGTGEGAGTDHAAALRQASVFLDESRPSRKLVFLLTDGGLDVSNSPQYGLAATDRNNTARAQAYQQLDALDIAGAQVWPIGFGAARAADLDGYARGDSCSPGVENPRASIVGSSAGLVEAVAAAFSAATCVGYGNRDTGDLPANGSVELHVDVQAFDSFASIQVDKRDPRVQVAYFAPGQNTPATGAGITVAGQSTTTESVRITDPTPGRWTIRLSSAVAVNDVSATAVTQAAVQTYLTVNPPQPVAGQTVTVDMQIWARSRAVLSPGALRGLSFAVTLTGAGFAAQRVPLADPDGDGTFSGRLTVPKAATGDLTFTGRVTGVGIDEGTRVLKTRVQQPGDLVRGSITFEQQRPEAQPGSTLPGLLRITNASDRPQRLRLTATDVSPGSVLVTDPPFVDASPGGSTTPFTVKLGQDTPLGLTSAILQLVSDPDPSMIVSQAIFSAQVTAAPTLTTPASWSRTSLTVLAAVAVVLIVLVLRRRVVAWRGGTLTVRLYESGMLVDELSVPRRRGKALRFSVRRDPDRNPGLRVAAPSDQDAYVLRRDGGGLDLRTPDSSHVRLVYGRRRPIGADLSVTVLSSGDTTGLDVHDGDLTPFPRAEPYDPFAYATADPFSAPGASAGSGPFSDPFSAAGSYAAGSAEERPPGAIPVPATGAGTVTGAGSGGPAEPPPDTEPNRLLVGHLPSTAKPGGEISLTVRVVMEPAGHGPYVALMRPLPAGPTGRVVTLVVEGAPGLTALGPLEQQIHVPPHGDSDPVRFAFRTPAAEGLLKLRVIAFAGGTFLAELSFQVSVSDRSREPGTAPRVAGLPSLVSHRGEVTLHVRRDQNRYSFQLLSGDQWFDPVLVDSMAPGPDAATEATIAMLRRLAAGDTSYTSEITRKLLQNNGTALWNGLVPEAVREQFWQLRSQVTAFTIATGTDTVPWELLYPKTRTEDEGFLVEQFPVNRWVYRQRRAERISLATPRFIVPRHAPENAHRETGAIQRILSSGEDPHVIDDLTRLLDLLEGDGPGLLHFACHNNYRPGAEGSSIEMADGDFVPVLLERAKAEESLSTTRPLVFINACRSAGAVPHYTNMMGFAQQFLAAGAGAFVGTLWDVRSGSAQTFAEEFYRLLKAGENLGTSVWHARRAVAGAADDPTWLAYTVYGDPQALPASP